MRMLKSGLAAMLAVGTVTLLGGLAQANDDVVMAPTAWGTGFQTAHSPVMERVNEFHNVLLYIIIVISAFVLALMAWIIIRYNKKRNPTPQKWSHNTLLEMVWTAVPVIILLAIAIPSIRLLYYEDRVANPEMTIKAIGHQWYWSYEYPDHGGITFDAIMKEEGELAEGEPRLLATDNAVVLPAGVDIRILTTADDVIHAFALPALGVKIDAVPMRINETWVHINSPGIYYGQCSELCGTNHGFMPIMVKAVSKEEFAAWVAEKKAAMKDSADVTKVAGLSGADAAR
ncbi:MAG: cytochrome c oxidase subunit II [Alphaproteobacteria bacterium]|nr:cytochrome c oxidase subunit II [Alphaproteobacteria bacterium]